MRCPFCAHQQRVPDGMLQQLRDYRERFAQQQVQADGAAADAESWQNYSRTAPAPISGATLFLAQFVLRLPLGIGPLADKAFGITVTKAGIVAMYAPAVGGPCLLALYWYARGSASAPSHRRRGDLGVHWRPRSKAWPVRAAAGSTGTSTPMWPG